MTEQADVFLEYKDISMEDLGFMNNGRIKLSDQSIQFKNAKTGKLHTISAQDIDQLQWIRLANKPGLKVCVKNGAPRRFAGFSDPDVERIRNYASKNWHLDVEPQLENSVKGWNYGQCNFKNQSLEFEIDKKVGFEIPLSNVSNCVAGKNEAALEFHQNDDCSVSLMEMRFHIGPDQDTEQELDQIEEFRRAVLKYAGVESETDQPVATLKQILCTTPRGRYDIKVYPNNLSLHGKTYDYKIPIKTITRLFLLPHKDGRRMYFVISVNPPIRQGQTRYHFLVLEFNKDEEVDELELGLSEDQIAGTYKNRLDKVMTGPVYEVVSRIFRVLMDQRITVPGGFVGHSGTPAISCACKQAAGFLYPLEKGFVYVYKPPMYIRFEEIATLHFARSDVATKSFDFELELKSGQVHVFNNVEKEEYTRLYDFVVSKHLRIRDAKRLDKPVYTEDAFADSDDELDPYKEQLIREGEEKDESDSEDEDSDYDVNKDQKKQKERRDSSSGSATEPDEEYDSDAKSEESDGDNETKKDTDRQEDAAKKSSKKEKQKKGAEHKKVSKKRKPEPQASGDKKSKKREKDKNAPKRPMTAYMIWFGEKRGEIKKSGDSVTDTAKRAGGLWKAMSAEDKDEWEEKAVQDKERYKTEMAKYERSAKEGAKSNKPAETKQSPTKSSPNKQAKSKEFVSDSDNSSEDDKPLVAKKDTSDKGESDSSSE